MYEPNDAVPTGQQMYPGQQQQQQYPAQGYYGQQGPYPAAPYPQQYAQPYPPMMVAPKSPGVAVLASFFIPGLGSMISGRGGMGALILCLYVFSWILTLVLIGFIGVLGCWIWGMVQGHADAVAWNRSHGIVS